MLAGQQKTCGLIILMCGWFLSFLYNDANRSESQEKKLGTNMALFLSFIIFFYIVLAKCPRKDFASYLRKCRCLCNKVDKHGTETKGFYSVTASCIG